MGEANLAVHFADGAKVGAWPRTGDFYPGQQALGKPAATATAGGDGVKFTGLPNGDYWAAPVLKGGEKATDRAVGFTVKDVPAAPKRTAAVRADPQRTPRVDHAQIVTGPKGTRLAGRLVHTPAPKGVEAHPARNQASVADSEQQRSATPVGEATPVDPDERQPHPSQDDVPDGTDQRSDTQAGEAQVVGDLEHEGGGALRQDEYDGEQRSDTEHGQATPIPGGKKGRRAKAK